MRVLPATIACLFGLATCSAALAWGSTGHQLVGATAYANLGKDAKQHVDDLLKKGHAPSLAAAAEWPDCVRSVKGKKGHLAYKPDQFTPKICSHFSDPTEDPMGQAMMVDYATRNFDNCDKPKAEKRACHELYHFADIPIADGHYDTAYPGAPDYDIVATINACVSILRGEAVKAPFDKISDFEALFLLAHLVGDLHQPLHVGAIYLDGSTEKTPTTEAEARRLSTQGGNSIFVGTTKLHGMWDTIDGQIPALQIRVSAEKADAVTNDSTDKKVADWASASVKLANEALHPNGVVYADQGPGKWSMTVGADYQSMYVKDHQISQAAKGGNHLAELLNQIWP
jgi:hypothetical protein